MAETKKTSATTKKVASETKATKPATPKVEVKNEAKPEKTVKEEKRIMENLTNQILKLKILLKWSSL